MRKISIPVLVALTVGLAAAAQPMQPIYTVPGELDMLVKHGHVQGLTCSEKAIYISHSGGIAKIDWNTGHVLKTCDALPHLGDIAYADGRIYGAYGLWNVQPGESPLMVGVWDEDLNPIMEKRLSYPGGRGLDGAVVIGDKLYVSVNHYKDENGAHPPHRDCTVLEITTSDLSVVGTHEVVLDYPIYYGVQTLGTDGIDLLFGNYGASRQHGNTNRLCFSRVTTDFALRDSHAFPAGEGFCLVPRQISGSDNPIFLKVKALGGNMQGWRKDPIGNPPRIRFDFYEYDRATGEMRASSNSAPTSSPSGNGPE
jgi:hypothetical protein